MNLSEARISQLWQKFEARQASQKEVEELFAYLAEQPDDETSSKWLRQQLEAAPQTAAQDRQRWQPVLDALLKPPPPRHYLRRIPFVRWTAAAAIAGGCILAGWLICRRLPPTSESHSSSPAPAYTLSTQSAEGPAIPEPESPGVESGSSTIVAIAGQPEPGLPAVTTDQTAEIDGEDYTEVKDMSLR